MSEHSTESTVYALRLMLAQTRDDPDMYDATIRELNGCPESLMLVIGALSDFAAGDHIALLGLIDGGDGSDNPAARLDAAEHIASLIGLLLDLKTATDEVQLP